MVVRLARELHGQSFIQSLDMSGKHRSLSDSNEENLVVCVESLC
jgi:hypothetical protein